MKIMDLTPEQESAVIHNTKHLAAFRIFTWFVSRGAKGGTTDECEGALEFRHQSASPRINELARAGCIVLSKERRKTRSKKTAGVYKYVEGASFAMFLGLPSAPRKKKVGLNPRDQAMLDAAKTYVAARTKVGSPERVKGFIRELVETLNGIAMSKVKG
jgi:hypothetical protein